MLLRLYSASVLILLSACSHEAQQPDDPVAAAFLAENPGLTKECAAKARKDVMAVAMTPVSDCYVMQPPTRWTGVINLGWEWSNFCPSPAAECFLSSEHDNVWTDFAPGANLGPRLQEDGLYKVEFVGRRTVQPGHFGHLGQYNHYMMVDRVISIQKLPEGSKK